MQNPFVNVRGSWSTARDYFHEHDIAAKLDPLATAAGFLIVLGLVALGIYVVAVVPHVVIQRSMDAALSADRAKQLELEDTYRKTITQIVLGIFGLFLLYFTWRRSVAGDKTVRIAEQGHITDRFTKAIEQLGKTDGTTPNIEVRLGAIYALERIALDSPRDHWTIMEVLTAYVRQNAPLEPERPYIEGEKPRTEIQAILTVLGRRKTGSHREVPILRLDLSASRLCGADLQKANLRRANFNNVNLDQASLDEAKLQQTWFGEAKLRSSSLWHANLQEASFYKADLTRAYATGADLYKASLMETTLDRANLFEANLQEVTSAEREQIQAAINWNFARYSPGLKAELGLSLAPTLNKAKH